jgi:hypothetical protein
MFFRSLTAGAFLLFLLPAAYPAGDRPALGDQVVAYCKERKGEQVGSGECSDLAAHALRAAGANQRGPDDPNQGDYVWGTLVFHLERSAARPKGTGKPQDVRPGDIIQFRDARFERRTATGSSSKTFPHHTAVIIGIEDRGKTVRILHQNYVGKRFVQETSLRWDDLTEGWVRVYRPAGDDAGK